ncbi:MAG: 3-oxoacyl-ACP reductase FabG [Burkholderiaceae bacterium]|nr:3-oxoacyl-ACP reductase FabG [Burkholderiaceae bacterium]
MPEAVDPFVLRADALGGEVALVTGAARGIGRAIFQYLARAGACVVGTATTGLGVEAIDAHIAQIGARGNGALLNVRDAEQIDPLVESIAQKYGRLSVLVNNAGVTQDGLAMRMRDEQWNEVIDTNLSGAFRLSRRVIRDMLKARHGRIINISSVVASSGNPGQVNYAASKAGLEGMTRSLARELAGRSITVNCVAPGFIDTDMARALAPAQSQAVLAQIPAGRLGQADEVAAVVAFLASPAAAYITGATVHVNGGMHMT